MTSNGLKCAPVFAQQDREEEMRDFEDNISAIFMTWKHHILLPNKKLHQLEANGFNANRQSKKPISLDIG